MIIKDKRIIRAVRGGTLDSINEPRYILINDVTGEIVDDAQGYGYKDARRAYAAYGYKHRDKTKDRDKRRIKKLVTKFCKDNPNLIDDLRDIEFRIMKMQIYDESITFNAKIVSEYFKNCGIDNLEFSIGDFLKYWDIE